MSANIKDWKLPLALVFPALLLAVLGCASAAPERSARTGGGTAASPSEDVPAPAGAASVGTRVGDRIPDFTLKLADGSAVTSQELVSRGQPTFLFFFATW